MRVMTLAVACVLLAGCLGGEHDDLEQWMNEESKKIKTGIAPLPEVKPYVAVEYDAQETIEPFSARKIEAVKAAGGGGKQPDRNRQPEPLEKFPLESLKFVGFVVKGKMTHAIIMAAGQLHEVKIGNYMGQNFGMVTDIQPDSEEGPRILLRELVQESGNDWMERTSTLLLQEQGR